MTAIEVILSGLRNSLRPDDQDERIRLTELDEIFEGKVIVLRRKCPHVARIIHTNKSEECLSCHEMLKEVPMKETIE